MRDIYQISSNTIGNNSGYIYVRATYSEILVRQYYGGFQRFLACLYDFGSKEKYPRGAKIKGIPIISLKKFDEWIAEHI